MDLLGNLYVSRSSSRKSRLFCQWPWTKLDLVVLHLGETHVIVTKSYDAGAHEYHAMMILRWSVEWKRVHHDSQSRKVMSQKQEVADVRICAVLLVAFDNKFERPRLFAPAAEDWTTIRDIRVSMLTDGQ